MVARSPRRAQKWPQARPHWTWAALAAALAVHAVMLVSLKTHTLNRYFSDTRNRPGPAGDFFAVYHAGRQALTGRDPYLLQEAPAVTPPFAPFRYTPGVAFSLGMALAPIKPWTAYALWIVILELLLAVDLFLLRFLIGDEGLRRGVAIAWLVFSPYYL